ncbi:odorant receptor 49b-like [Rhynchophorus ferrugineus]
MSDLITMTIFFALLSLQIFVMAWNTNEIKIKSVGISDAIFESDWYLMDKEGQQLTHMVMMRSQRPLAITIGPFGPMTTQSAFLMLKAAYSYISIMK